ncbi:hypothetical protein FOZ62_012666 [Perkinsus olseni]|uniref:Uncharacterized protein n=3 Tax=Perkinsus olseni TaxID=32597 RepID=A0A7J6TS45_PEROL|nr:hypothetical protein FOZ62_012666 [Perkinsus olseni]
MDHIGCSSFMTSSRAVTRPVDPKPESLYGLRSCGISTTGQIFPRPQRAKNHLVKSMASNMPSAWCHPLSRVSCARNSDVNELTEGWTYDGCFDDATDQMEPWTLTHTRLSSRSLYERHNKWAAAGFDLFRPRHTDLPKRGKAPHWVISEIGSKLDTVRTSAAAKWSCGSAYEMHKPTAVRKPLWWSHNVYPRAKFVAASTMSRSHVHVPSAVEGSTMGPRKKPGPKPGTKKPSAGLGGQPDDDGYAPFHKLVNHPPLVPSSAVYATFLGTEVGSDTESARKRTVGALCHILENSDLPREEEDAIVSVIMKAMIRVPDPSRGDPRVFNCFEAWAQKEMCKAKDKDPGRYQAIVGALMEIYNKKLNRTYPKLIRDPGAEHAIFRSALMHYCATGSLEACLHDLQRKTRQWNVLPRRDKPKPKGDDDVELSSGSYSSGSMSSYEIDDNAESSSRPKSLWSVRYSEVAAEWERVLKEAVHPERHRKKVDPDDLQRQVFQMGDEPWRITQAGLVKILYAAASLSREGATRIDLPEWFLEELTLWTPDKHDFEHHIIALRKLPTFNIHQELLMRLLRCESQSSSLQDMTDTVNTLVNARIQFDEDPAAPKGAPYAESNGLVFDADRIRLWYNLFWCPPGLKLRPAAVCRLSIAVLLQFCAKNWRAMRIPGGVSAMAARVSEATQASRAEAWAGVDKKDALVEMLRKKQTAAGRSGFDFDAW